MSLKSICLPFILLILVAGPILCQDTIVFSDRSIEVGKVLEVNLQTVKYTKAAIADGPVYEVEKEEILYIKYPGGYRDIFNRDPLQIVFGEESIKAPVLDSIDYAEIYIVFNYGLSDDQRFPLYFNGIKIGMLRNKSRLKAKIYSEGLLKVERLYGKKHGPGAVFHILNGSRFAIEIIINDPYGLDPNHRFHLKIYEEPEDVKYFITTKYQSFEPSASRDIVVEEDLEEPWIWED